MSDKADDAAAIEEQSHITRETGPYILRPLLDDIPLAAEGHRDAVRISCVELWQGNLYVGTSGGEIIHYVLLPPDPLDQSARPTYIFASRLQPPFSTAGETGAASGVQQILLLPNAHKACVLCNSTLTFYSLPELSPAFGTTQVRNCSYVGGVDLDAQVTGQPPGNSEVIMISMKNRIRLVRIGEEARPMKNIEYPGSLLSLRRGSFACVANGQSYALLDVDHQQKIPLFPISSVGEIAGSVGGQAEAISSTMPAGQGVHGTSLAPPNSRVDEDRGHSRSTSLGTFVGGLGRRGHSPRSQSEDRSGTDTPEPFLREGSPAPAVSSRQRPTEPASANHGATTANKPLPQPPTQAPSTIPPLLKPNILSPTAQEFLLTTGTNPADPGVGIFVNLDGDVSRGTLEFDSYPEKLVVDGRGAGVEHTEANAQEDEDGWLLCIMQHESGDSVKKSIQMQRWDVDSGDPSYEKEWMEVCTQSTTASDSANEPSNNTLGLHKTTDAGDIPVLELKDKLRLSRLRVSRKGSAQGSPASIGSTDSRTRTSIERVSNEMELFESQDLTGSENGKGEKAEALPQGWEASRRKEEDAFAQRFTNLRSRIVVWKGDQIWWAVRTPLALRLDARLDLAAIDSEETGPSRFVNPRVVVKVLNSIRGQEPRTESEFLSLGYIRQKASLLLYMNLLVSDDSLGEGVAEGERRYVREALIDGGLDPRVVLAVTPELHEEVIEGRQGTWIYGGIQTVAQHFTSSGPGYRVDSRITLGILELQRQYLTSWRRKKGFGSISDEREVFLTIDAALLRILLQLDKAQPKRASTAGMKPNSSIRAELYALVDQKDQIVDCFDRAVALLERYERLYILSRLYQSRKMAKDVLSTWRRILEGEYDDGGEFADGELEVRKYLSRIRDSSLVEEYGAWLAARSPKIGVQVFTDDHSRVKLEPTAVVDLLTQRAPGAVKEYLEHLVFGKNNPQYVNELIKFYLDNLLSVLQTSESARSTLLQSYETYRALDVPRPTYQQFITDNAIAEEWWHNRLRLLQLIGGSHGAASAYDVPTILQRLEPFEQELVPEMIILDGRQARHSQALRLLTHGLGDYDTAINYCLLGGSSIFYPSSSVIPKEAIPSRQDQTKLFDALLLEFLQIEDFTDRVEQTGNLLDRFGGWFDTGRVLSLIPDSWSVELVSGFLVSALRQLLQERSETTVAKALSGAENIKTSADFIKVCDERGPSIEAVE